MLGALRHFQIWYKACVGLWLSTTPPGIHNLFLWIDQSLSPPSPPSPPSPLWFFNPYSLCGRCPKGKERGKTSVRGSFWLSSLSTACHAGYNPRGISATCNMKSRLAIKFPTPYEWWSNALPPRQEKASNTRGMSGGMLKLRFDWYIMRNIGRHSDPRVNILHQYWSVVLC